MFKAENVTLFKTVFANYFCGPFVRSILDFLKHSVIDQKQHATVLKQRSNFHITQGSWRPENKHGDENTFVSNKHYSFFKQLKETKKKILNVK